MPILTLFSWYNEYASLHKLFRNMRHFISCVCEESQICWTEPPFCTEYASVNMYCIVHTLRHPVKKKKKTAWWRPDNSIHLFYPLDSSDLLWQSITFTISSSPGFRQKEVHVGRVSGLASGPYHSWTVCTCGLGPWQPHVLALANISRELLAFPCAYTEKMEECAAQFSFLFFPLVLVHSCNVFAFHLDLMTWKISSIGKSDSEKRGGQPLRTELIDL